MYGMQPLQAQGINKIRCLEGRRIHVALTDGSRIDDCVLVSAHRAGVRSIWVFTNDTDVFVPLTQLADIWEAAPLRPAA